MKLHWLLSTVNPLILGLSLLMPSFGSGEPNNVSRKSEKPSARPFDDPGTSDSDAGNEPRLPMFDWNTANAVVSGTTCTNQGSSPNVALLYIEGQFFLELNTSMRAEARRLDPLSSQIVDEYNCHVQIPVKITKTKWSTRWAQELDWVYVQDYGEDTPDSMSGEVSLTATLCGLPTIPVNKTIGIEAGSSCALAWNGAMNVVPETLFSQGDTVDCLYEADVTVSVHSNNAIGQMAIEIAGLVVFDENTIGAPTFEQLFSMSNICVDDSDHTYEDCDLCTY